MVIKKKKNYEREKFSPDNSPIRNVFGLDRADARVLNAIILYTKIHRSADDFNDPTRYNCVVIYARSSVRMAETYHRHATCSRFTIVLLSRAQRYAIIITPTFRVFFEDENCLTGKKISIIRITSLPPPAVLLFISSRILYDAYKHTRCIGVSVRC